MDLVDKIFSANINKRTVLKVFGVGALTLLLGCNKSEEKSEIQELGISDELQALWPIWTSEDLEYNKYHGPSATYKNTINMKPPFYDGPMPFVYKSTKALGMGSMMDAKVLRHQFDILNNFFIYENFRLAGAVSVIKNTLMAEARIRYIHETIPAKVKMEEFHYFSGRLIYHCNSDVDINTGMKMSEKDISGRKVCEFYPILPFSFCR